MKLTTAQVAALKVIADGNGHTGSGIRAATTGALLSAGFITVESQVRKVTGRLGNALPRDRYYCDWSATITDAGRAYLATLA